MIPEKRIIIIFLISFLCIASEQQPINYFSQCLRHMQTVQELEKAMSDSSYEKALGNCSSSLRSVFDNYNKRHGHDITSAYQFIAALQINRVDLPKHKNDLYNQFFLTNSKSYKDAAQIVLRQEWKALPMLEKISFENLLLKKLQQHRLSLRKKDISLSISNSFQLNYEILNQMYIMAQKDKHQIRLPIKTLVRCAGFAYFIFCTITLGIIADELYHMSDPDEEICPKTWF